MGSATYALIPLLIAIQLLASCSKDTSDASKSKALEPRQPPQLTKDIDWYAPHAISETCTITEGPGEMIKTVKAAGVYYSTTDEIRSGDVLVQVTLVIPSAGTQVTYYRSKERCAQAVNDKKASDNAEINRFK